MITFLPLVRSLSVKGNIKVAETLFIHLEVIFKAPFHDRRSCIAGDVDLQCAILAKRLEVAFLFVTKRNPNIVEQ